MIQQILRKKQSQSGQDSIKKDLSTKTVGNNQTPQMLLNISYTMTEQEKQAAQAN